MAQVWQLLNIIGANVTIVKSQLAQVWHMWSYNWPKSDNCKIVFGASITIVKSKFAQKLQL